MNQSAGMLYMPADKDDHWRYGVLTFYFPHLRYIFIPTYELPKSIFWGRRFTGESYRNIPPTMPTTY